MDKNHYLQAFCSVISNQNKDAFDTRGIRLFAGQVLDSVALKAYRPEWSNETENPLHAEARIFFSIWVNEKTIAESRLYYNIHALKLWRMKGYTIKSRLFAEQFRKQFEQHQRNWPHVRVNFGPATLMQGWLPLDAQTVQKDADLLLQSFLTISPLIDQTLDQMQVGQPASADRRKSG